MRHLVKLDHQIIGVALAVLVAACSTDASRPTAPTIIGAGHATVSPQRAQVAPGSVGMYAIQQRPSWMTADRAAQIDSVRSSPHFQAQIAKMKAIVARGEYSVALVPGSLAPGVTAIVRLNQPGTLRRYIVAAAGNFDDIIYRRAVTQGFAYEWENYGDQSPITLTIRDDGSTERASASLGTTIVRHWEINAHADDSLATRRIRTQANAVPQVTIPGFGIARLWHP